MKKKILLSLAAMVVLGGLVLVGIFAYGFRVMSVPSGNMSNTLIPGEQVAVTRFYGEVKRGDIVVFKWPKNPNILYIERVIGLPGETIEVRGKQVFINGQALAEQRVEVDLNANNLDLQKPLQELAVEGSGEYRVFYDKQTWEGQTDTSLGMNFAAGKPYKIPPGQYFMLGDSRDNSQDSRFWGTVAQDAILWKAYMISSSPVDDRVFTKLK